MALIRLCTCADCSAPLLFVNQPKTGFLSLKPISVCELYSWDTDQEGRLACRLIMVQMFSNVISRRLTSPLVEREETMVFSGEQMNKTQKMAESQQLRHVNK